MSDDKRIKKYFENMPYGGDAKSSEIHGKACLLYTSDAADE